MYPVCWNSIPSCCHDRGDKRQSLPIYTHHCLPLLYVQAIRLCILMFTHLHLSIPVVSWTLWVWEQDLWCDRTFRLNLIFASCVWSCCSNTGDTPIARICPREECSGIFLVEGNIIWQLWTYTYRMGWDSRGQYTHGSTRCRNITRSLQIWVFNEILDIKIYLVPGWVASIHRWGVLLSFAITQLAKMRV